MSEEKEGIFSAAGSRLLFGGLAVGVAAAFAGSRLWIEPQKDAAFRRYRTTVDVLKLYGLEVRYKQAKGVYASDLNALLALEPRGAARRARMGEHLDLSTLAVVGDDKKFKIEANVLDENRTLIKIRGPLPNRPALRAEPDIPPETELSVGADGRPIAPGASSASHGR